MQSGVFLDFGKNKKPQKPFILKEFSRLHAGGGDGGRTAGFIIGEWDLMCLRGVNLCFCGDIFTVKD